MGWQGINEWKTKCFLRQGGVEEQNTVELKGKKGQGLYAGGQAAI